MDKIKAFFLDWAEIIDAFRVVPRAVLFFYGCFTWKVYLWIKTLETPSLEQTGIFYAIIGIAGMIIKFYMTSGRAWGPQLEWKDSVSNDFLSNQRDRYYGGNQRSSRSRSRTRPTRSRSNTTEQEEEDG